MWIPTSSNIHTYESRDGIVDASPNDLANYPLEFLNSLEPNGVPPHHLRLAVGAVVILLHNIDTEARLCNEFQAVIRACHPRVIDVQMLTGRAKGKRFYIPRIELRPQPPDLPFVLKRRQFPIRLAYAMTINKAQGQTLTKNRCRLARASFHSWPVVRRLIQGWFQCRHKSRGRPIVLPKFLWWHFWY